MKTTITALALVLPLATASADAKRYDACSATSRAAKEACAFEAKDDLWIALGTCANVADPDARKECKSTAREALAEAKDECREQFDAREEVCEALGQDPYDPAIDPSQFLTPEATAASPNPYFPLIVGTTWTYEGPGETVTVTVTDRTKEILGVTTIVVRDVVTDEDDETVEDTDDYFAQHMDGTVWYFGELAKNFEDGELVDVDGSWTAGVDGAKPGIVMEAVPAAGDVYRQEFFLGDAEDVGEVVDVAGTESVPAASCAGTCAVILDTNPLEPDAAEHKYYAPGIGLILEVDLESGERVELVSVTTD
jgi:hypothetical protein